MEKWFIKNKKADFSLIGKQFGISEVLARLIINRGVRTREELEAYLAPDYSKLHDPLLLKDVDSATDLLIRKIKDKRKIRIVGDYDVDGVISTYILKRALDRCNANADYEIPDRIKDGYGINISIIEEAHRDHVDTIITCDNGIAAIEQIAYAKSLGMTVIITDHHDIPFSMEEGEKIYHVPKADAVINPKQINCDYPFKGICGATVAYKLIEVLYHKMNIPRGEAADLLEFVAVATVCDVMDLIDENRIIVKIGLEKIKSTNNLGLKALIHENQLEESQINTYHLGFIIGPCINASGRLESAKIGLKMLLSPTRDEAVSYAQQLKKLNEERKEMTNRGVEDAVRMIENTGIKKDKVLVVYLNDCHESIAGIIAGRIKDKYNKPTIILTKGETGAKGSARSIEEYNMFEELSLCKGLLEKFGGHPMAAGLSLKEENIDLLREQLNQNTSLTEEDFARKITFDMVLPFQRVNVMLIEEFSRLEPFGKGNVKPLFAMKNIKIIKGIKLGQNKNVLKLSVSEDGKARFRYSALLFFDVPAFEEEIVRIYGQKQLDKLYEGADNDIIMDIIYYPDINEYNGYKNIQFIIQNYRFI